MKRFLLIALVVILVAIGLLFIPGVRRALGISVSSFVTQQIERVAEDFLKPTLSIGAVTYTFPTTVGVQNLTLTQDDVTILEIPRGTITLVNFPISSGKVRFRNFVLESPVFRMVVDEEGSLVGWDNLLKSEEDRTGSGQEDAKASDAFAIKDITVLNATIEYQDLRTGLHTMRIDEFDFQLEAKQAQDATPMGVLSKAPSIPTTAGWYHLTTTIDRAPLIAIEIDSGLNIDNGDLIIRSLKIQAQLNRSNDNVLPPQIQSFVREYSINGSLEITVFGSIPSDDPLAGPLEIDITLDEGTIGKKEKLIQVSGFEASGSLEDGLLEFDNIEADLLDGRLEADIELRLANRVAASKEQAVPGDKVYSIACGLQLEDINLKMLTGSAPPNKQMRGLLDLDIEAAGIVTRWPQTLVGDGQLTIRNSRLANVPVISALGRAMRAVIAGNMDNDRLNMILGLRQDGVVIKNLSLIAGMMAVRGSGIIRFNDTIEFVVNGGPLERLQKSLGTFGSALGNLTDRIVCYQVVGSLESPVIRVRPLGIATGDPTAPPKELPDDSGSSP